MNEIKINFKWMYQVIPGQVKLGLVIFAIIASFEGVINGIVFGELVKINYHNLAAIFTFIGLALFAFVLVYVSSYIFLMLKQYAIRLLNERLKYLLFSNTLNEAITNDSVNSADAINQISAIAKQIEQQFFDPWFAILQSLLLGISSTILVLKTNLVLGIIYLLLSCLSFIPSFTGKKILTAKTDTWADTNAKMLVSVKDIFKGRYDIVNFGVKKIFLKKYQARLNASETNYYKMNCFEFFIQTFAGIIAVISLLIPIFLGLIFINKCMFNVTISAIVTLSLTADRVVGSVREIAYYQAQMQGTNNIRMINLHHIKELNISEQATKNNLTISNLEFTRANKIIFKNVNLYLKLGDKVIITGDSGIGKSTLLKLIARQITDYNGTISIGKRAITPNDLTFISQNVWVFQGSIRDNLTLYQNYSDEDLLKVLKQVGLTEELGSNLLNYQVTEDGSNLSGGQAQRIAIARGLLRNKNLFILDEITSNLDQSTAQTVRNLVYSLPATVIEVAHNFSKVAAEKHGVKIYQLTKNGLMIVTN